MSIKRAPHVGFSAQIVPKWKARVDLARMMTRQLSKRFGHRNSVLIVTLSGEQFHVPVRKNKYPGNTVSMWEIIINPPRFPVPSECFPEEEQQRYAKELMVISNEVHAVLTRTPGIGRLRWWFVGWDASKPGVRTPAELPWRIDIPQVREGS